MRLVFILYAEDRGLLSNDPVYVNYYSVTGLFDRLRADAGRYPDTMDQRYGAWAQLLTLFRLIYEGGSHGGLQIPARQGYLFDPDRYLPRRPAMADSARATHEGERPDPPRFRRRRLPRPEQPLILDGERLSYRTLDVEQIGSVYEAIMGFNLEVARGRSIAIKPKKAHGAPTTINLEELLAAKPADRPKWLKEQTDQALTGQALDALKKASDHRGPAGGPGEADRPRGHARTSSPRGRWSFNPPTSAAGPVRTTRRDRSPSRSSARRSGRSWNGSALSPTPEQILDLKVCDPAMGSGAFLVEACRQLGRRCWSRPGTSTSASEDPAR